MLYLRYLRQKCPPRAGKRGAGELATDVIEDIDSIKARSSGNDEERKRAREREGGRNEERERRGSEGATKLQETGLAGYAPLAFFSDGACRFVVSLAIQQIQCHLSDMTNRTTNKQHENQASKPVPLRERVFVQMESFPFHVPNVHLFPSCFIITASEENHNYRVQSYMLSFNRIGNYSTLGQRTSECFSKDFSNKISERCSEAEQPPLQWHNISELRGGRNDRVHVLHTTILSETNIERKRERAARITKEYRGSKAKRPPYKSPRDAEKGFRPAQEARREGLIGVTLKPRCLPPISP
uniref:Uncharacterized protein n=1 Tax=Vespula pensylvanica TaxID=30213 RepID=A0A834KVZ2_VESPE|nr:hypothetical protein H0235_013021 [Vespula pensylvanica]